MFANLKKLKESMEEHGWVTDGFEFLFNSINYYVLAHRCGPEEEKPKYTLMKLEFINSQNVNYSYIIYANSRDFLELDVKSFRDFFNLPYGNGPGDVIRRFKNEFSICIPSCVNEKKEDELKKQIVRSLSNNDSQDPEKIYCTGIRRNEVGKFRSIFNGNKAKILVRDLYEYFALDETISFCFSKNPLDEKKSSQIIAEFLKRK